MKVTPDPTHPSGIHSEHTPEEIAAGMTDIVLTGPIAGTISMADGTAYDVSNVAIAVKPAHTNELLLAIHKAHHAAGRFTDVPLPSE
jgi:hypothetical protein